MYQYRRGRPSAACRKHMVGSSSRAAVQPSSCGSKTRTWPSRIGTTRWTSAELVQRQEYLDTTIAKNITNIFNLITRRSERLQKRRAGGRRPPAAQLSLWLQWGHRTKRIDMHRTRTGHHDGNRRRTTTTQPQTSSRAVTRAVTHATYISSMRAVNSTMRLRNTRPTAGTAVLPAGERTPHAPRSSASHR